MDEEFTLLDRMPFLRRLQTFCFDLPSLPHKSKYAQCHQHSHRETKTNSDHRA